jgi:hypothetical protein
MEGDQAKADGYRERAKQLRAIAEALNDAGCQRDIMRIATAYEHLAETFDPKVPNSSRDFG